MRAHFALEYTRNTQVRVALIAVALGLVVGLFLVFSSLN